MNERVKIEIEFNDIRDLEAAIFNLNSTLSTLESELKSGANAFSIIESGANLLLGTLGLLALSSQDLRRIPDRIGTVAPSFKKLGAKITGGKGLAGALALLSGPKGWLAIAGIGLVGLIGSTNQAEGATARLTREINENRNAHQRNRGELYHSIRTNRDLISELRELQNIEGFNRDARQRSIEIIRILNDSIDGLNLSYENSTGLLDLNGQAIFNLVDYYKRLDIEVQRIEMNQNRLNQATQDYADIDLRLDELNEQLSRTARYIYDNEQEALVLNERYVALENSIQNLTSEQKGLAYEMAKLENQTAISGENMSKIWEDLAWQHSQSFATMTDSQQAVVNGFRDMFNISAGYLNDLTRNFKYNNDLTWESAQANQARMIEATDEHTALYSELINAGISEAYLSAIGADSARAIPLLREMQAGGIDEIKARQTEWYAAHENNANTMIDAIDGLSDVHRNVIRGYVKDSIGGTFQQALDDSNFRKMGESAPNGFMDGVRSRQEAASNLMDRLMQTLADSPKSIFIMNSPSRLFRGYGTNIIDGLNIGLNQGESSVLTTARRIANNIASTMRSALQINSPSRLMREQIGRQIPAGVAEGIDKYADYALDSVYDLGKYLLKVKIPKMSDIIPMGPSLSLAGAGGAYGNTSNDNRVVFENRGMFEGATFPINNDQDIDRIMEKMARRITQEQMSLT